MRGSRLNELNNTLSHYIYNNSRIQQQPLLPLGHSVFTRASSLLRITVYTPTLWEEFSFVPWHIPIPAIPPYNIRTIHIRGIRTIKLQNSWKHYWEAANVSKTQDRSQQGLECSILRCSKREKKTEDTKKASLQKLWYVQDMDYRCCRVSMNEPWSIQRHLNEK